MKCWTISQTTTFSTFYSKRPSLSLSFRFADPRVAVGYIRSNGTREEELQPDFYLQHHATENQPPMEQHLNHRFYAAAVPVGPSGIPLYHRQVMPPNNSVLYRQTHDVVSNAGHFEGTADWTPGHGLYAVSTPCAFYTPSNAERAQMAFVHRPDFRGLHRHQMLAMPPGCLAQNGVGAVRHLHQHSMSYAAAPSLVGDHRATPSQAVYHHSRGASQPVDMDSYRQTGLEFASLQRRPRDRTAPAASREPNGFTFSSARVWRKSSRTKAVISELLCVTAAVLAVFISGRLPLILRSTMALFMGDIVRHDAQRTPDNQRAQHRQLFSHITKRALSIFYKNFVIFLLFSFVSF